MPANPFPIERETLNTPRADRPTRTARQGLQAKKEIVNQVIEGRMPLVEAAIQFQAAHRLASVCLERSTSVPSATADTESACRALIGWVHLTLSDRPEQADLVSERLERELQCYLDRVGKPGMPPVR